MEGKSAQAFELYRWFLPLLRLDTVPKFIQLIKLVQQELGIGNARVRAPKLELIGEELAATKTIIRHAIQNRPKNASSALAQAAR
jgi:dihydrodipicolinate synthase/N-acetylneuraminate lyase